jgi:hypothetical protein
MAWASRSSPLCSSASFKVNSESHTGARPSVRLCVGPELARCVHSRALTSETTPRLCVAGAGGATTAKTCVCSAELLPNPPFFEGTSPCTLLFCLSADCSYPSAAASRRLKQRFSVKMMLIIFSLFFCLSAECPSPATAASRRCRQQAGFSAWAPRARTCDWSYGQRLHHVEDAS